MVGNAAFEGLACRYLGHAALLDGALTEAEEHFERAHGLAQTAGDAGGEALALAYLAVVAYRRTQEHGPTPEMSSAATWVRDARTALEQALEAAGRAADPRCRAVIEMLGTAVGRVAPANGEALVQRSGDLRLALRVVRAHGADERSSTLRIDRDGRWFELELGTRIEIGRRRALRRILVSLARHHETAPGEELEATTLLAVGWPGERVLPDAASRRVRTAIWELRKLGLGNVLRTQRFGYVLARDARVAWA
jgi:hypothetical protein